VKEFIWIKFPANLFITPQQPWRGGNRLQKIPPAMQLKRRSFNFHKLLFIGYKLKHPVGSNTGCIKSGDE
jgi:hypothetical protein